MKDVHNMHILYFKSFGVTILYRLLLLRLLMFIIISVDILFLFMFVELHKGNTHYRKVSLQKYTSLLPLLNYTT